MNRQERWREKGITEEQIQNHLKFEQYKAKQYRDKKKKNNEKNKEIISKITSDIVGKTFDFKHKKVTVLSISPTSDGQGFFFKVTKKFNDGSEGEFREFSHFDEYKKEEFIKYLGY